MVSAPLQNHNGTADRDIAERKQFDELLKGTGPVDIGLSQVKVRLDGLVAVGDTQGSNWLIHKN